MTMLKITYFLPGVGAHSEVYDMTKDSDREARRLNEKELRWPIISIERVGEGASAHRFRALGTEVA